jgi:hypothetical protein
MASEGILAMGKKQTFLVAEKWTVGYRRSTGETTLVFEFAGREPINLLIPTSQAEFWSNIASSRPNRPHNPAVRPPRVRNIFLESVTLRRYLLVQARTGARSAP